MTSSRDLPAAHVVAVLALPSTDHDLTPRGAAELEALSTQAAARVRPLLLPHENLLVNPAGHELILSMDRRRPARVQRRLDQLAQAVTAEPLGGDGHRRTWLEVGIGWKTVPARGGGRVEGDALRLSLIHISEPTRPY